MKHANMQDVAQALLRVCGSREELQRLLEELLDSESAQRSSPFYVMVGRIWHAAGFQRRARADEPKELLELIQRIETEEESHEKDQREAFGE